MHGLWVADYTRFMGEEDSRRSLRQRGCPTDRSCSLATPEASVAVQSPPASPTPQQTSDATTQKTKQVEGCASGGIYATPPNGLFPAAWPADQLPPGTLERFHVLGISVAKCLQVGYSLVLAFVVAKVSCSPPEFASADKKGRPFDLLIDRSIDRKAVI